MDHRPKYIDPLSDGIYKMIRRHDNRVYAPVSYGQMAQAFPQAARQAVAYGAAAVGRLYQNSIRNARANPAAAGAGAAGVGAYFLGSRKRRRGFLGKRYLYVKKDGTSTGKRKVIVRKRRKKKTKTLKQQVNLIKKSMPKHSVRTKRVFRTLVMSGLSAPNIRGAFYVPMYDKSDYTTTIEQLAVCDGVGPEDYTLQNTKVLFNQYYQLTAKNNSTGNTQIEYMIVMCKDDDNESPLQCAREELVKRGYLSLPTIIPETAATATTSVRPQRMLFTGGTNEFHVPVLGNAHLRRNWKPIGGVKKAVIGPGDTFNITWSRKNFTFKKEVFDMEPLDFVANHSCGIVIVARGELAHDQTNVNLVGYGGFHLDCEEKIITTVKYNNPKGLNDIDYEDTLTNVNFTVPVHGDNHASAIEIVDV